MLTACFHKTARAPVQALPPPSSNSPKPETTQVALPPSAVTIPPQPLATGPTQSEEESTPPARHRKPRPQPSATDAPPAPPGTQQAASGPPAVSAIGQLSSADPSDLRGQTEESLKTIERGLNSIESKLTDGQHKTAAQIREYLKQARQALISGDVDGAHTLAAKARVLLDELYG
jgi:hypothetical protein